MCRHKSYIHVSTNQLRVNTNKHFFCSVHKFNTISALGFMAMLHIWLMLFCINFPNRKMSQEYFSTVKKTNIIIVNPLIPLLL